MKAELDASWPRRTLPCAGCALAAASRSPSATFRNGSANGGSGTFKRWSRLPPRLTTSSRRLGYTNPFETLHGLAITLYILPLLYAALSFGWEGAILTALWAAALTSPSIWIWHRSGFHWFTELGQLAVTLPVGVLVAWRVDLEAKQRRRAEETSASLTAPE